ncbi:membrane protein insertion efficiency factor YidD [Geodermatophilus sp. SYSU D00691]
MRAALLAAVRFYQRAISPALPPRCRFYPTCSAYALEAIERHGAARGTWLALRRLAKCAPWHPGGVDLVPEPRPGTTAVGRTSSTAAPAAVPGADGPHHADRATTRAPREESSIA